LLTLNSKSDIKLALPKGKLLTATARLLQEIDLGFENYNQDTRIYRFCSTKFKNLSAKVFHEKDVPIQIAVGNYDLGICGLDWIEELLAKYPQSPIISIASLEFDRANIYLAAPQKETAPTLKYLKNKRSNLRIVTEYPNVAEAAALNLRLKRFSIFPVWGAAEAYPPEDADLAVLRGKNDDEVRNLGLIPLKNLLSTSVFLIANRESMQNKNISQIIARFSKGIEKRNKPWLNIEPKIDRYSNGSHSRFTAKAVRLAVPDGHQQSPAIEFLARAGLNLKGYSGEKVLSRRPTLNLDWINIKVIRPQDMPMQVANGNFDLAITGKDWLLDHLYRFPSSPITSLVDLAFGGVKVVAVVSHTLPATNIEELKKLVLDGTLSPLRVASEYINVADKYLRDNHVGQYKLIPTWGASEAFLPEDADLLIENTQTGKTLAIHNLIIIDTLFHSTACLIGNKNSLKSAVKREKISCLVNIFQKAAEVK
jgi:ATP phosphoribosyltransferase